MEKSTPIMTTETHYGRSIRTRLLQIAVRTLRPWRKAGPDHNAGSPRLTIPEHVLGTCKVEERNIEDSWIYELEPQDEGLLVEAHKKRVYYFAGGGFRKTANGHHWSFIAELTCATPTCVTLVSYPLAPHSPAKDSIPHLAKLYYTIMAESAAANEVTVFMGDSAGGNIVLCLPLYVLSKDPHAPVPTSILTISPGADCRMLNVDILRMSANDPFLSQYIEVSKMWCEGIDPASPMVSPVLADLEALKKRNVEFDGIAGTWDVLWPDIKLLKEKAERVGVTGAWYVAEEQMHCFPLAWWLGLPEAVAGKDWIVQRIKDA